MYRNKYQNMDRQFFTEQFDVLRKMDPQDRKARFLALKALLSGEKRWNAALKLMDKGSNMIGQGEQRLQKLMDEKNGIIKNLELGDELKPYEDKPCPI